MMGKPARGAHARPACHGPHDKWRPLPRRHQHLDPSWDGCPAPTDCQPALADEANVADLSITHGVHRQRLLTDQTAMHPASHMPFSAEGKSATHVGTDGYDPYGSQRPRYYELCAGG